MGAWGPAGVTTILILLATAPLAGASLPWELPLQHQELHEGGGWSSYRFDAPDQPLWIETRAVGGAERHLAIEVVDDAGRVVISVEGEAIGRYYELRLNDGSGDRHVLRSNGSVTGAASTSRSSDCRGWGMLGGGSNSTRLGLEITCASPQNFAVLVWAVGDELETREVSIRATDPLPLKSALSGDGGIFLRAGDFGGPTLTARVDGILMTPTAAVAAGGEVELVMQHGFHGSFGPRGFWRLPDDAMELRYESPSRAAACPCEIRGEESEPGVWSFHLSGAGVTDGEIRLAGVDARYPPA